MKAMKAYQEGRVRRTSECHAVGTDDVKGYPQPYLDGIAKTHLIFVIGPRGLDEDPIIHAFMQR